MSDVRWDNEPDVDDVIDRLANALWAHRNDWWEDASEQVNRRHRDEVNAALDGARALGWVPHERR